MGDAELGRLLRRCRESVRPPYSQRDLAECLLSPSDPQTAPFPYAGGPDALAHVIGDFEQLGQWPLSRDLLGLFLMASFSCLDMSGAKTRRLKELTAAIVDTVIPDPSDRDFVGRHIPPDDDE